MSREPSNRKANADSISPHYQGGRGEIYATKRKYRQDVLNHLGYQLQKRFFAPFLKKNMNVLDFGCGNGSLAKALEPHVNSIEGLEVNSRPRDLAISQNLVVYDQISNLPDGKLYDAIISNHVLEHIPNVIATLKILRGHMQPDGIFIILLPIEDFRTARNKRWRSNDPDHHLHTWTPLLFGNTLQEAGLEPIKLSVITHTWTPKLFFLGDTWFQQLACYILSMLLKRRQLLAVAVKMS